MSPHRNRQHCCRWHRFGQQGTALRYEGAFWQSRYKSIALLDTEALLAVCAYIDLNVFAAGMAELPEKSPHTSIRKRVEHCAEQGRLSDLQPAELSTVAGVLASQGLESNSLWLCPIEDRRHREATARPGLLDGFSLGSYLQLVDWTSRIVRKGKRIFRTKSPHCSSGWALRASAGPQP